jgi:hypothetical protein
MGGRLAVGLALLAPGALLASGLVWLARGEYGRLARARHLARDETELRVVNAARAEVLLYEAGDELDRAAPAALPLDGRGYASTKRQGNGTPAVAAQAAAASFVS